MGPPAGHPHFFSLEGIDGSGKSTQLSLLAAHFRKRGMDPVCVREPGGTPLSDKIRQLLLAPENCIAPAAELLLYSAARAQLVSSVIAPALQAGKLVLADRFGWSTLAYQGYGRGLDSADILPLFQVACGNTWPSQSFLLDIPVSAMPGRMASDKRAPDRMESENGEFFERVRQGYLRIARDHPDRFTVLDGSRPKEAIHRAILEKMEPLLLDQGSAPRGSTPEHPPA